MAFSRTDRIHFLTSTAEDAAAKGDITMLHHLLDDVTDHDIITDVLYMACKHGHLPAVR